MKRLLLSLAFGAAMMTAAMAAEPAKTMDSSAGKILVDMNGMTLYIWDKDTKGAKTSACTDKCPANWPGFAAAADAKAEGKWTIVDGFDKDAKPIKVWAYDGWPLYYFAKDAKTGDVAGNGAGGNTWHVVKM
jgi:predicted lipoprotein with Yx(FWY)xxD motif